ncbi:hypothetical protein [Janibacter sp. YB324]|uniref:hypothetical protein n=1 Tax=Janibacter sp. YB324 TaxID=2761047 RepID=UPI00162A6543|nr:hypothetical protein [Janibacter sp. YB324]QNF93330.1 hypothetical protein H7A72_11125 [Janibacter sp. YB324]
MRRRLTLAVGVAISLTFTTTLPSAAFVPTKTIIGKNDKGSRWKVVADTPSVPKSRTTTQPKGAAEVVSTSSSRATSPPPPPLTDEQRAHIAARVGSCVGAKVASGAAVSDCFGSAPAADVVPAAQVARPRVTAASVRQEAVDQITLTKPDLQASPCLADAGSCRGTVGVPVWLWVGDGDGGLPSESASATAGRFSIQATAKVSKVKWSLGDGQSTVCSGAGTKYDEDAHGWSAPECGFENGWKKPGTYTLTATYVWDISWSGDQTGSATQSMSSTRQVTVGELQSVVSRN